MKMFLTILLVAGFVIPLVAAAFAYVRFRRVKPVKRGEDITIGEVTELLNTVMPQMVRDQAKAVGWPAFWVMFGLLLSTVGSIVPVWVTV